MQARQAITIFLITIFYFLGLGFSGNVKLFFPIFIQIKKIKTKLHNSRKHTAVLNPTLQPLKGKTSLDYQLPRWLAFW
jgi:hypothetical protein